MVRCAQSIAPDGISSSAGSEKKVDALTPEVPQYLMSTVNEADAKRADSARMQFKDVVKANFGLMSAPVWVTETGHRWHQKTDEWCLRKARGVFLVPRCTAGSLGKTRCGVCG